MTDLRKDRTYHWTKAKKVKKLCLAPDCKRIFYEVSALSMSIKPTRIERGICLKCKALNRDYHYGPDDWNGQEIGLENE